MTNKESSLREFWHCLQLFYVASGLQINHNKIGVKSKGLSTPYWILKQGCQIIQEWEICKLLGIPMGFDVSIKKRWDWLISKLALKLNRWENTTLSFAGKILTINHYIILTPYSSWPTGDLQSKLSKQSTIFAVPFSSQDLPRERKSWKWSGHTIS